jgi:hypothetical protein
MVPEDSFNTDRCCSHDRYYRFHKAFDGWKSAIPELLFYYLDRCVRHPRWNHNLVMAEEQKEIAHAYEHIEVRYLTKFGGSPRLIS